MKKPIHYPDISFKNDPKSKPAGNQIFFIGYDDLLKLKKLNLLINR